jgi:hypothetical protein
MGKGMGKGIDLYLNILFRYYLLYLLAPDCTIRGLKPDLRPKPLINLGELVKLPDE